MAHDKKLNEKIAFSVFDENLNSIAEKEIELPYLSLKHISNQVFINNIGYIFLTKKIYAKKRETDKELIPS